MPLSICVLGEKDSGKSSLIAGLAGQTVNFNIKTRDLIAADYDHLVSNVSFTVAEYSWEGEIRGASILLITFDASKNIEKIAEEIKRKSDWITSRKSPYSIIIAVGTKIDKIAPEGNKFISQQIKESASIPSYFVSTNKPEDVKKVFEEAADLFLYFKLSDFVKKYKEKPEVTKPMITLFPACYKDRNIEVGSVGLTWAVVLKWAKKGHVKTQQVLTMMDVDWNTHSPNLADPPNYLRKRPEYFPTPIIQPLSSPVSMSPILRCEAIQALVIGAENVGKTSFVDAFLGRKVDWSVKKSISNPISEFDNYQLGNHMVSFKIAEFREDRDLRTYHLGILILDFSKKREEIEKDLTEALELQNKFPPDFCWVCVGTKLELNEQKNANIDICGFIESERRRKGIMLKIPLYFVNTKDNSTVQQVVREALELFLYYPLKQFIEDYDAHLSISCPGNTMFAGVYSEKNTIDEPPTNWMTIIRWAQEEEDQKSRVVLKKAGIDWRTLSEALIDPHSPSNLVRKPAYLLPTSQLTESEEQRSKKQFELS